MTKEFTDTEIAQLNQEFKTANAFTQWKFMQTPEFQRLPLAVRCTIEKKCLTHYFNILTDGMDDWKMPIKGKIPISLLNPYRKAVEYFTGTELHVVEQDGTEFYVFAKGYYMMGEDNLELMEA
jgi:hypothetical protein